MLAFIRKVVRAAVVLVILSATFLFGWAGNYLTSRIYHSSETMCYVENAVVVACQRVEDGEFYVWNIVAVKNEGAIGEEFIFIKHRVGKIRFQYAF